MDPLSIRELYVSTLVLGALAGLAKELRSKNPLTIRSILGSVLWSGLNSIVTGMLYKEFIDQSAMTMVPIIGLAGAMGGAVGFERIRTMLAKANLVLSNDDDKNDRSR